MNNNIPDFVKPFLWSYDFSKIDLQKDKAQPMTYQMLARSLACNLDLAEAHAVLDYALGIWPEDKVLLEEKDTLILSTSVFEASSSTH